MEADILNDDFRSKFLKALRKIAEEESRAPFL